MKKYSYILILTILFTIFLFYIKNIFIKSEDKVFIENKYMEQSLNEIKKESITSPLYFEVLPLKKEEINEKIDYKKFKENILKLKRKKEELKLASKVSFIYIPRIFEGEVISYSKIISLVIKSDIFNDKIIKLGIEMYKKKIDIRGKMKDGNIKIFGVLKMDSPEFISLFMHEFSHYIDLYYFNKTIINDVSDKFYNISWNTTKILKKGQKSRDFVSGYAMTNKYEDFAESFTYYVLHNKDFIYKMEKSELLKNKYDFFKESLFKRYTFVGSNFSVNNKVLNYYRDITKINIKEQKFLQYLKN